MHWLRLLVLFMYWLMWLHSFFVYVLVDVVTSFSLVYVLVDVDTSFSLVYVLVGVVTSCSLVYILVDVVTSCSLVYVLVDVVTSCSLVYVLVHVGTSFSLVYVLVDVTSFSLVYVLVDVAKSCLCTDSASFPWVVTDYIVSWACFGYILFSLVCVLVIIFLGLYQPWCNPLWLTGLKAPANKIRGL